MDRPFVQDIVVTIYPDGRLAQCIRCGSSPTTPVIAVTMRLTYEDGFIRVKTKATDPGYLISIYRDGESLVLDNKGVRNICERLSPAELPDWYSDVMARAIWR